MLYNMEGELNPAIDAVDISSAKVRRPGKDVTVVTYGGPVQTLNAVAALAQDGIEAEVIDLRSLRPLEMGMMVESVAKMRRILVVDEVWKSGSISPEIAMRLIETGVLRARRADPSGVQRRSADALCSASRATGFAPSGDCGHRADPGEAGVTGFVSHPSADMEAGTLVECLKKPGNAVRRGDVVGVVETQKGTIEIVETGVLDSVLVQPGKKFPVGRPLANLCSNGAAQEPEPAPPQPPPEVPPQPESPPPAPPPERPPAPVPEIPPGVPPEIPPSPEQPPVEIPEPEAKGGVRVRMTPAARRRAAELGLDPSEVRGTGPDGTVSLADVEAVASGRPVKTPVQRAPRPGFDPAAMRKAIAAAMARSKREIPHYYLTQTIDLDRALAWLEDANLERPPTERLLPAALFLKASALALRKVPELNGFWAEAGFCAGAGVHVGWAIALRGGGLIAPGIHDADQKSLAELMTAMRDLVQRARSGGLRSSELTDPTITVTSLGERGAETVIGVIYPPQVAIVGFGRIVERPWAVDRALAVRPVVSLSLAADHRASDGHRGSLLLAEIDRLLQEPGGL